jgi:hypothetical protein
MVAMRNYLPGGMTVIRFIFGFALAAGTLGYLLFTYIEVDPLVAAENFGYMMALSVSLIFMKFGFAGFKFWTLDNDFKTHLVSQWDRIFGISGWLLLCVGLVSALSGTPERLMENASIAIYGLFYSYVLKGFILTALYPNPDDDLYYVETNHTRHRKIENANEAVLH